MKKTWFKKRNQTLKMGKILSLPILQKMRQLVLKRTLNGVAEQPFDEKVMSVTDGLNQPSQQKPGIKIIKIIPGKTLPV